MRIYKSINAYTSDPNCPLILGLGNFDGVHLGHKALIQAGSYEAESIGGISAVFTFLEHPQRILHPSREPRLLTSIEHKMSLFQELGVKACFLVTFTKEFSELEPEEFVQKILVERLNIKKVRMGYNARFGHARKGDPECMSEFASRFGFSFEKISPVRAADGFVSSSRIRQLISDGQLTEAEACLGHSFSFYGKVVEGEDRGSSVGFPTANLDVSSEVFPPEGVYAVRVRVVGVQKEEVAPDIEEWDLSTKEEWMPAVMNYGRQPTFHEDKKSPLFEVHVLNFEGDLYGKTLEVEYCGKIRPEKKFSGVDELKSQIEKDIQRANEIFSS